MSNPADLQHLSAPKQALVAAAQKQGYNITSCGNREVFVLKGVSCRSRGLMITEDGTIMRTDLPHDLKATMTLADAKKHLHLQ